MSHWEGLVAGCKALFAQKGDTFPAQLFRHYIVAVAVEYLHGELPVSGMNVD